MFWYLTMCCDNNYINWYIIRFRRFCHYSRNSGLFSLKHFLNFCLFKTIMCMMFTTKTNNAWICQWYSSWFNKLCSNSNYRFNKFSGNNMYYKLFSLSVVTCVFNMTSFTTIWTCKLLFNNNITDYRLCNWFGFWVSYQDVIICYDHPFSSQITATSLCLIRVFLAIPTISSLK